MAKQATSERALRSSILPNGLIVAGLLLLGVILVAASFAGVAVLGESTATIVATLAIGCTAVWVFLSSKTMRRQLRATVEIFDRNPNPYFATDAAGRILEQNKAAQKRFGDASTHLISDLVEDMFANPKAVTFRLQNRAKSGEVANEFLATRNALQRLSVTALKGNHFLWHLEDMGEKIPAEGGGDMSSLPMACVDANGEVASLNLKLREMIGGTAKSLKTLVGKDNLSEGDRCEIKTLDGLEEFRAVVSAQGDSRRNIYFVPSDGEGSSTGLVGSIGIKNLPVPLLVLAADGRITEINPRAASLIRQNVEPGAFVSDVFFGLGRSVADWLGDAQEGRSLGRPEVLMIKDQDTELFLQVTLARLGDGSSGPESGALLAVLNDATELKTLEAQFVQSQKMQAIGQLAGGVAHDFNNLLTAISGHCDLLLLRHDKGDPEYADLVQIHQNANRAASLVGQLLAFSRKQNLQPEVLDLRETLSDLIHLLNRLVGEKVELQLEHDPNPAAIRADKRQLEQVLMNLVVNARDAMPSGGTIKISTSALVLDTELERNRATVPAGEYIVVSVSDEGVGIPTDKLPKIFEPFFTTKRMGEGTGLGLSTAYGIVKQTGGFIFADSEVNQGTTFSLYFPLHKPSAAIPATPKKSTAAQINRPGEGVVLLVEDEAPVRAFASRALRMRGYKVLEAENAEEALETLKDEDLEVDVFVTDVIMPGLDGPTWVLEALKTRPDTKVIFVSGYAEESITDQQQRIPNSVFLPKPFSLNELATTVMEQIH